MTAVSVAVAPEDAPVIISEVENAEPGAPVITTLIGLVVLIILAVEPLTLPVIFSPLVNVPVCVVKVTVGATASVEAGLRFSFIPNPNITEGIKTTITVYGNETGGSQTIPVKVTFVKE